jgi:hypothetical protein
MAALVLAVLTLAAAEPFGRDREPPRRGATVVAAGDVASCASRGDERTARLIRRIRGTIAVLGDTVYERGTRREFRRCYHPTWGTELRRTRPALGNHEYRWRSAAGYFDYFGRRAGARGDGWYSYELGRWHVVVLNTNCSRVRCGPRSRQYGWLRRDLSKSKKPCTLAYGHHPRFSSGFDGPHPVLRPLFRLMYAHGVELYLAGHDHHYERFAPVRPDGRVDRRQGLRQFVVGTGGRSLVPAVLPLRSSRARAWRTYGVLVLRLLPGRFTWRFRPVPGSSFRDVGGARCHRP